MRIKLGLSAGLALVMMSACVVDWTALAGPPVDTAIDTAGLQRMLTATGLKPRSAGTRLDFDFKSRRDGQEWDFAMSAVLSQDGQTLWVVAWLEEMPKAASKVPTAAMLRLLAENDRMGNGKFFAYDRRNRRFLLQRVIANRGLAPAVLTAVLRDVAGSVMDTHLAWSVAGWQRPVRVGAGTVPPAPPAEVRRR